MLLGFSILVQVLLVVFLSVLFFLFSVLFTFLLLFVLLVLFLLVMFFVSFSSLIALLVASSLFCPGGVQQRAPLLTNLEAP